MKRYLTLIILYISCISAQVTENTNLKLKSMVLPGWGEQCLGESKRAKQFFIREAVLWLIYINSKKTANTYQSNYIAFAQLHANAEMEGKNYLFSVNMGHYNSLEEFNNTKGRKRLVEDQYGEGQGFEWRWDNDENRTKFDAMRINSVSFDKCSRFAIGGLILNRLVSFIDIIYLENKYLPLSLSTKLNRNNHSLQLQLSFNL